MEPTIERGMALVLFLMIFVISEAAIRSLSLTTKTTLSSCYLYSDTIAISILEMKVATIT